MDHEAKTVGELHKVNHEAKTVGELQALLCNVDQDAPFIITGFHGAEVKDCEVHFLIVKGKTIVEIRTLLFTG
jgi:hypothetical protein